MKRNNELPLIENDTILLRPITLEDTDNIIRWRNSPEVSKNFIFRDTLTREMHMSWLNENVFTGKCIQYIIEEKHSNIAIGSVYFRDVNFEMNSAEFGIFIGEDAYRGKGIGSNVTNLFKNFGFQTLKLKKIFLRVIGENIRAYKSYVKAGFVFEHYESININGKEEIINFMVDTNIK